MSFREAADKGLKMSNLYTSRHIIFLILFLKNLQLISAFYLPGLAPVNYCKDSEKTKSCKVSKITQVKKFQFLDSSQYFGIFFSPHLLFWYQIIFSLIFEAALFLLIANSTKKTKFPVLRPFKIINKIFPIMLLRVAHSNHHRILFFVLFCDIFFLFLFSLKWLCTLIDWTRRNPSSLTNTIISTSVSLMRRQTHR